MTLRFCPLASGSKGNALFLETPSARLLIDMGISLKNLEARLSEISVAVDSIDAILITHDHTDHILGLGQLTAKHGIPVFANGETAKGIVDALGVIPPFKIFTTGEPFLFKECEITPFSIPHDTVDPVGFTVKTGGLKLGFAADLGFATSLVKRELKGCDYLYLEANHEPSWVEACSRPRVYKERVLSRTGHLSNQASGELLADLAHAGLQRVHLAHLSSECNSEAKALDVIQMFLENRGIDLNILIAYQHRVSSPLSFNVETI